MDTPLPARPMPASQLLARKRTHVRFEPDAAERAAIARALDLIDLPAFRFEGEFRPENRGDLVLDGTIEAQAVQACIVTLAPVPARIREPVLRRYLADWQDPEGEEAEIPADDTIEPLTGQIDPAAVAIEALALALPEYPRAKGAALGAQEFPPEGAPDEEAPAKPLAGLARLLAARDKAAGPEDTGG